MQIEAVPILAVIILFCTICTFIFSIGAYAIFRYRMHKENKLRPIGKKVRSVTVVGELVEPVDKVTCEVIEPVRPKVVRQTKFFEYTSGIYVPIFDDKDIIKNVPKIDWK